MARVVLLIVFAFAAAVVAARTVYLSTADSASGPQNAPWALNQMEFVAWNGQKWTAWVRDEAFEQRPLKVGKWQPHANSTIAFTGWDGQPWQAKIDGKEFLLAARGDWRGESVARADALRYRDWMGRKQLRTFVQLQR